MIAFLNFLLANEGIMYESDKCLVCLSKHVNSFDFDRGGFICKDCGGVAQDVNFLKDMRILSKVTFENANKVDVILEDKIIYLKHAFTSLENKCGIVFKGKDFLFRVFNISVILPIKLLKSSSIFLFFKPYAKLALTKPA